MNNKVWLVGGLIAVLLTAGCGSGKDTRSIVYHSAESSKIVKQVLSDTSLSQDEKDIFQALAKAKNQKALEGKTVGELLDQGMKLKAQLDKEKETMKQVLSVKILDKMSLDVNRDAGRYYQQIQLDVAVANTSQDDIQSFKGKFTIADKDGKELFTAEYTDRKPLMSGVSRTDSLAADINDTNPPEVEAYNAPFTDLQITWEPTAIVYMDGKKIGEGKDDRSLR